MRIWGICERGNGGMVHHHFQHFHHNHHTHRHQQKYGNPLYIRKQNKTESELRVEINVLNIYDANMRYTYIL